MLKYAPKYYQEVKHECADFLKSAFGETNSDGGRAFGCAWKSECQNYDAVKCVLVEKLAEAKK